MTKRLGYKIFLILFFLPLANFAQAFEYTPEFPFPGMPKTISDPAVFVQRLYYFGLTLAGFLAVGAIALGGIMYMLGGTISKVEKAKEIIYGALGGVVLLLFSTLLLQIIDPSLLNLSPYDLESKKYDIAKLTQDYDLSESLTKGKTAQQIETSIGSAKITGSGNTSCSIITCGSQTLQGSHKLSAGAAQNFTAAQKQVQEALASQGLNASFLITSTVTGTHASRCHNASASNGGTCVDFVILADGKNIKNADAQTQQKYINAVDRALNNSPYVVSCLNEYKISTQYSTGGHFHCNL